MDFIKQEFLAQTELRQNRKTFKKKRKTVPVRLEENVYWTIARLARAEGMTISKYTERLVRGWLKTEGLPVRIKEEDLMKEGLCITKQ